LWWISCQPWEGNPNDNFESTMNKWRKTTTIVTNDGNSKHAQSGLACSDAH
jgi:hypothetical protein